jgi:hypothetical protein
MANGQAGTRRLLLNGVYVGEIDVTGDHEQDTTAAIELLKQKGLHKEPTTVRNMFRQALSFATTAAYLHKKDLSRSPWNGYSVAPFIVNSAFSIELYLKTLGKIYDKQMKGHDLLTLFDSLPIAAHQTIDAVLPACIKEFGPAGNVDLRTCISELANAFIEWRYLYERVGAQTAYIDRIIFVAKVMDEACRSTPAISAQ